MNEKSAVAVVFASIAVSASAALATPTLKTLVNFNDTNGNQPAYGSLLADSSGNLYGTTYNGGSAEDGIVFKLAVGSDTLSTVATFTSPSGINPLCGLVADGAGNLYGTTYYGGSSGFGTVFKIAAGTSTVSTLMSFNRTNGQNPIAGLVADASGNLYGTTIYGGSSAYGTVFKIAAGTNMFSTLATLDYTNGQDAFSGLITDASGNLYGTTTEGGSGTYGTVYKVAAGTNTLSTLVAFNKTDGASPYSSLIADGSGNLFGTTLTGGANNDGTVFEITAGTNTLTTLATFNNTNGANPYGSLLEDRVGDLYGTSYVGGSTGDGTVYEIAAGTNTITTLFTFSGANGEYPEAGLTADTSGNLYGTTAFGGANSDGTVFELTGTGFIVPEPGSLILAGVAGVVLLRRRRRAAYPMVRNR